MAVFTPLRRKIEAGKVSPVVSNTAQRRNYYSNQKENLFWAAINFSISILLFYELHMKLVQNLLGIKGNVSFYLLLLGAVVFMLNAMIDFIHAAQSSFSSRNYALSPIQRKLMGIRKSDINFASAAPTQTQNTEAPPPPTSFSLMNLTANQQTSTPRNKRGASPSPSPSSSFHTSFGTPVNNSFINSGGSPLCDMHRSERVYEMNSSMDSFGANSFLRNRRSAGSPLSPENYMTNQKTLNNYLKSHYYEQQSKLYGNNSSLWSQSLLESSLELSRNFYQISSMSPKSPITSSTKDDPAKIAATEYWTQAGVNSDTLRHWMANLRRWISVTILNGLVKEIDGVNESLKSSGLNETQVGECSLSALKTIRQKNQVPKLSLLLPYLEVSSQQTYVVSRIRTLASGGYMSEFSWSKGGRHGNKEWKEDLVTDSALIMHLLCVYMDQHLPPHPRYPDGTVFTSQHYVGVRSKAPEPSDSPHPRIYQSKLHPPHYRLVTSKETYDLSPGRYNMLCTILLFLHVVKIQNSGMMGQVNLGLSGINILCIVDDIISPWTKKA